MIREIENIWNIGFYIFLGMSICFQSSFKTEQSADVSKKVSTAKKSFEQQNLNKVYNLQEYEKLILSKKLLEISGLTIDAQDDILYAINDEKGILFKLNQDGKILSQIDFGKNADYEGIEKVDNRIFILKSNGKIIEFDLIKSEVVESHNNSLSQSNDTEGLGYDATTHSLLIACKGSPNIKSNPNLKKSKAVYAYDIASKKLVKQPILTIADEHIKRYVKTTWKGELSKKKYKKKLNRATKFSPSAIAVHPIDGYYYLLSTLGKTLIVADHNSEIKFIYFLDDPAYIHPEGICFENNGNMWISNEGKGLRSNILKISMPN